ncbi:hypothetical protein EAF04_005164 [Stromatinia cepivora]|nr:hypothetical protein EAF04_005164 [Stromatinia cepivora]
MLNFHHGTEFDLGLKEFLKQNCKFLLELCEKPVDPKPVPAPLTNLKLQLIIVDRSLEAGSKAPGARATTLTKAPAPRNDSGTKVGTDLKGEVFEKLSELFGSFKSGIEVVSNGDTKLISNVFNSLEQ